MEDRMFKAYKNFGFISSPANIAARNEKMPMKSTMKTFIKTSLCEDFERKPVLINTMINNAKIWQDEGLNNRKVQGIFELKKRGINQWKRSSIS
jgi:hypothetical protein